MVPEPVSAQTRWGKASERQWPRFKVDFSIKVILTADGSKTAVKGRAHDLGEGGLSIYVVAQLREGQQVQLEFTPPFSRRAVEVPAIVRDHSGYRYGLQFRNLTRDATEEISRSCRALFLAAQ